MTSTGTGSKNNLTYEFGYHYTVDGKAYIGKSFGEKGNFNPGDAVTIQLAKEDAAISRIKGTVNYKMPFFWMALILLFPLAGIFAVRKGISTGAQNILLVTNGVATIGKLVRQETRRSSSSNGKGTNVKYLLYFQFTTKDGKTVETLVETYKPNKLLDEKEERLVYDPSNPGSAVLIDTLPSAVRKHFENS